jgi:hypothetical protein
MNYLAHDKNGVEKIKLSYDDQFLITLGKDSTVSVMKILDQNAKADNYLKGYNEFFTDILLSKNDLEDIRHQRE